VSRYVYHYHGFWQPVACELSHVDGTVLTVEPVNSQEAYQRVKELIAKGHPEGAIPLDKLILSSLSYLGKEDA
jgi:hypothetical protein